MARTRIHLLSSANPAGPDAERLGFQSTDEYLDFIRRHCPSKYELTFDRAIFAASEDPMRGGRSDDELRIADLNGALADSDTAAIIATNGGGWFARLLPSIGFAAIESRVRPLVAMGFSELTSLVNIVASSSRGRGVYWLCPNYLGWKLPAESAREGFAAFWLQLDHWLAASGELADAPSDPAKLPGVWAAPIEAELRRGRVTDASTRFIGGCLSVLAALVGSPLARRLPLRGAWLAVEDVNEAPHRIDRHLAALALAGWLDEIAGILLGDFHTRDAPDQTAAVLEILHYHLRGRAALPVAVTRDVGHVWPMKPLHINRPYGLQLQGQRILFTVS